MTSSNGSIFRVTGPLCGEFTGPGEFPTQRPVTRSFDVFFDLCLNKRLSKQPWGWWFETPSLSLWHHCNGENSPRIDFHGDVMMWKRLNVTGPWWEDQLLVDFSQRLQVMKAFLLSCWLIESPWRPCDLTVITEMTGKINVSSQICLRMGSWPPECAALRVLKSWKK